MHAGSREGKGAVQKMVPGSAVGSISETVKMRSSIPCLIIRPSVSLLAQSKIPPNIGTSPLFYIGVIARVSRSNEGKDLFCTSKYY